MYAWGVRLRCKSGSDRSTVTLGVVSASPMRRRADEHSAVAGG